MESPCSARFDRRALSGSMAVCFYGDIACAELWALDLLVPKGGSWLTPASPVPDIDNSVGNRSATRPASGGT